MLPPSFIPILGEGGSESTQAGSCALLANSSHLCRGQGGWGKGQRLLPGSRGEASGPLSLLTEWWAFSLISCDSPTLRSGPQPPHCLPSPGRRHSCSRCAKGVSAAAVPNGDFLLPRLARRWLPCFLAQHSWTLQPDSRLRIFRRGANTSLHVPTLQGHKPVLPRVSPTILFSGSQAVVALEAAIVQQTFSRKCEAGAPHVSGSPPQLTWRKWGVLPNLSSQKGWGLSPSVPPKDPPFRWTSSGGHQHAWSEVLLLNFCFLFVWSGWDSGSESGWDCFAPLQ